MSEYTEITLGSVPHTNEYKKRGITRSVAENKLNSYYKTLGFVKNSDNVLNRNFTGNIDTLIENVCREEGGKRKNKTRKRK